MPELPRLAIAYGERSVPLLELAAAARGIACPVWVLDTTLPGSARLARVARKLGPVVDLAGLDDEAAAATLEPHEVSGLVTFFDTGMPRLAQIAAGLGLRFHSPEVARALTDKSEQRRRVAAAGIPGPRTWSVPPGADPAEVAKTVTYPSVLKPETGDGSRQTYRLDGPADTERHLAALQPPEPMVVEELLVGYTEPGFAGYVSVESLVRDGVATHLTVTGRLPPADPFRETGFFVPAALGGLDPEVLYAETGRILAALGVRDGACHTELVLTADGPRLLEVNGRLGGGIPAMVTLAGGPALIPAAMRLALGSDHGLAALTLPAVGYRFLVQPPAGVVRVASYQGLEGLTALPGVTQLTVHHPPGTEIDTRYGSRSFVFVVDGTTADHQALRAVAARVQNPSLVTYG